MFSAGQTVTTTPTPTPTTGPQVGGSNPYRTPPTETTHQTLDYIKNLMCNRDVLDNDEYTSCADTLTTGYTTNRNLVPEFLRAAFDSAVEIVTNLLFTDCTAMEMRTRQSASARNRMCIPVAAETCEADRPVPPVAQCTYQAVMGENIVLLETSEPVALLGALFSYIASFAALAQMLGANQEGSSDGGDYSFQLGDPTRTSSPPPASGDCTPTVRERDRCLDQGQQGSQAYNGCIAEICSNRNEQDQTTTPSPQGRCGDGIVQRPREECDDGAQNGRNGRCDTNCIIIVPPQTENFGFNPYTT